MKQSMETDPWRMGLEHRCTVIRIHICTHDAGNECVINNQFLWLSPSRARILTLSVKYVIPEASCWGPLYKPKEEGKTMIH